jgi:predicted translin family RNA/ssDNA-binding protein
MKIDFREIEEYLVKEDEKREELIQTSRQIIKESKVIIYALQRGGSVELSTIKSLMAVLHVKSGEGIAKVAVQEYVEALAFEYYIKNKTLIPLEELDVSVENYLLGLCDLIGELVRLAVKKAIQKEKQEVLDITAFVEELWGAFLRLNLRNGELRKKSDSIKWNLQKLENLALDVSKN